MEEEKQVENKTIIEFVNATKKHHDGTVALDDINLTIKQGEFVFLVGSSGAGKTTVMNLIVKEDILSSGKVIVDGLSLGKLKKQDVYLLRRKVGYVFQDFKLLESKNVYENVAISLEVVGENEDKIKKVVPKLLHLVGLEDKSKKFPYSLSGGEKQRLAIARSLAHEPKILLADEPTGNLDNNSSWLVVDLIKKINEWGTTIVFGTHNMEIIKILKKGLFI